MAIIKCPKCQKELDPSYLVCPYCGYHLSSADFAKSVKATANEYRMKTAEEMYQFCLDNGLGSGITTGWALKHFRIIEEALDQDERALFCFIGLHNFVSITKHDGNFAYAITPKRIIMAQKKLIGQNLQTVALERVNDITFSSGLMFGMLTIDALTEKFNVELDKSSAKNISDRVHHLLLDLKAKQRQSVCAPSMPPIQDSAQQVNTDAIYKLKELFDMDIITKEEYEAKKKKILGI